MRRSGLVDTQMDVVFSDTVQIVFVGGCGTRHCPGEGHRARPVQAGRVVSRLLTKLSPLSPTSVIYGNSASSIKLFQRWNNTSNNEFSTRSKDARTTSEAGSTVRAQEHKAIRHDRGRGHRVPRSQFEDGSRPAEHARRARRNRSLSGRGELEGLVYRRLFPRRTRESFLARIRQPVDFRRTDELDFEIALFREVVQSVTSLFTSDRRSVDEIGRCCERLFLQPNQAEKLYIGVRGLRTTATFTVRLVVIRHRNRLHGTTVITISPLIHFQRRYYSSVGTIRVEFERGRYATLQERTRCAHRKRAERGYSPSDARVGSLRRQMNFETDPENHSGHDKEAQPTTQPAESASPAEVAA
jgi:hypothetical protein